MLPGGGGRNLMWHWSLDLVCLAAKSVHGMLSLSAGTVCRFSVPAASEQRTKSMMYSIPGNDDMDRATFGRFVEDFAKASGVSFADLADYLLVVPLHEFDPAQRS